MTRDELIGLADSVRIFKSKIPDSFSLTEDGLNFMVTTMKMEIYTYKFDNITSREIIMLNKVMKHPYYLDLNKNLLIHFDELFAAQSYFYRDNFCDLLKSFL